MVLIRGALITIREGANAAAAVRIAASLRRRLYLKLLSLGPGWRSAPSSSRRCRKDGIPSSESAACACPAASGQRIAVARALLKDAAPVIVLDEAASSLDGEAEQAMQRALGAVMRHKTTLIIAHRPSTNRGASRLIVLSRGQVVQAGGYSHLIRTGGPFADMIREGLPG
jgi:uncharacterized protein GlcG (DUF336 family)